MSDFLNIGYKIRHQPNFSSLKPDIFFTDKVFLFITSYTLTVHTGYTQMCVKPGCLWPKFGQKMTEIGKLGCDNRFEAKGGA